MSAPSLLTSPVFQAVAVDTVATAQVRDVLDYVQAGVFVLVAVSLVLLALLLYQIVSSLAKLRRSIDPLVRQTETGLEPILERARSVSENIDYVSHAVRSDVEGLSRAVERIRRRLDQASDRMEERIEEFNALMEIAQTEAEEIFLDTASTVRGVREGSRALAGRDGQDREPADDSAAVGSTGSSTTDAGDRNRTESSGGPTHSEREAEELSPPSEQSRRPRQPTGGEA